jgi:hypothetical protein
MVFYGLAAVISLGSLLRPLWLSIAIHSHQWPFETYMASMVIYGRTRPLLSLRVS